MDKLILQYKLASTKLAQCYWLYSVLQCKENKEYDKLIDTVIDLAFYCHSNRAKLR